MKLLLFILCLMSSFLTSAQEENKSLAGFDPRTDIISENYEAGPYLIYDCKEKHWVCVMEPFFKECEEKRSRDLASEDEVYHSCAPVGKFPTKKSCFQRQLFMTTHNHGKRFCVKDSWKSKSISTEGDKFQN